MNKKLQVLVMMSLSLNLAYGMQKRGAPRELTRKEAEAFYEAREALRDSAKDALEAAKQFKLTPSNISYAINVCKTESTFGDALYDFHQKDIQGYDWRVSIDAVIDAEGKSFGINAASFKELKEQAISRIDDFKKNPGID